MAWLFAVPIAAFIVFIVVGAITGHVEVRSCCGIADPNCDARMREAFRDDGEGADPPAVAPFIP